MTVDRGGSLTMIGGGATVTVEVGNSVLGGGASVVVFGSCVWVMDNADVRHFNRPPVHVGSDAAVVIGDGPEVSA